MFLMFMHILLAPSKALYKSHSELLLKGRVSQFFNSFIGPGGKIGKTSRSDLKIVKIVIFCFLGLGILRPSQLWQQVRGG